jgi:hypothetical protein
MASGFEDELSTTLQKAGVNFLWQAQDTIQRLSYAALYGVPKWATPDMYFPESRVFIEVKGSMTLHQVSKMIYLTSQPGYGYYVYQASEEDWDPTIDALVPIESPPPDSMHEKARKDYNRRLQQRELLHLAACPGAAVTVSRAANARLRAFVGFFDGHLRQATGRGLFA